MLYTLFPACLIHDLQLKLQFAIKCDPICYLLWYKPRIIGFLLPDLVSPCMITSSPYAMPYQHGLTCNLTDSFKFRHLFTWKSVYNTHFARGIC